MSQAPDDLVLEMLRVTRADISNMRTTRREHSLRSDEIVAGLAGLRRDQALDAEPGARVDRLRDEADRAERRLDIID